LHEIPVLGRNTQGVRLISLRSGEKLVGVTRIEESEAPGVAGAVVAPVEPDPPDAGDPSD
jgi:DNA gyrase subunit A